MAEYLIQDTTLTNIGDAIRVKTGKTAAIPVVNLANEILGISTGAELNFNIVSYDTEESLLAHTPAENTIGVITSTPITGYHFAATQPENMVEGEVWVGIGTTSPVEFNALKKNSIQVYPKSAKQMVSGALVNVTAKTYQNGAWADWIGENVLYDTGDQNEVITGGWVTKALKFGDHAASEPTITDSGDVLFMEAGCGVVYCANKINLSQYETLYFDGTITSINAAWCRMCVWTEFGTSADKNISAQKQFASGTHEGEQTLDVSSLSGEYYVGFFLDRASATMSRMWLE